MRLIIRLGNNIAAADIDLILQGNRHRHGRESLFDGFPAKFYRFYFRGKPGRKYHYFLARPKDAATNPPSISTEIRVLFRLRPYYILHRKTAVDVVVVAFDMRRLQHMQ